MGRAVKRDLAAYTWAGIGVIWSAEDKPQEPPAQERPTVTVVHVHLHLDGSTGPDVLAAVRAQLAAAGRHVLALSADDITTENT